LIDRVHHDLACIDEVCAMVGQADALSQNGWNTDKRRPPSSSFRTDKSCEVAAVWLSNASPICGMRLKQPELRPKDIGCHTEGLLPQGGSGAVRIIRQIESFDREDSKVGKIGATTAREIRELQGIGAD